MLQALVTVLVFSLVLALPAQAATKAPSVAARSVLVLDQDTGEVLYQKNSKSTRPIASITKLMTALVIAEAELDLNEVIEITRDDHLGIHSRLAIGTKLERGELLHLALMSSENRAAHALARTYPGGMDAFVAAMNRRAWDLGMTSSAFVEPTGLSAKNVSSPEDLAKLVDQASTIPEIRNFSADPGKVEVQTGRRTQIYSNSNALVPKPTWDINLSKTGFIRQAGRCLVMQAEIAGRKVVMVLLGSPSKLQRIADAERLRGYLIKKIQRKQLASK